MKPGDENKYPSQNKQIEYLQRCLSVMSAKLTDALKEIEALKTAHDELWESYHELEQSKGYTFEREQILEKIKRALR